MTLVKQSLLPKPLLELFKGYVEVPHALGAESADGSLYICVTAMGGGIWPCIFDHVALYEMVSGA